MGWERFKSYFWNNQELGIALDVSAMNFAERLFDDKKLDLDRAFQFISDLESGAIANPDEQRMVGHYWLRSPDLSPSAEIKAQIESTVAKVKAFAGKVLGGQIKTCRGERFESLLLVGIGGSALGPQLVDQALARPGQGLSFYSFDNTDPDGMERELARIPALDRTLCVIISKSGGTRETLNGQLIAQRVLESRGIPFAKHAVAVTGAGSKLDQIATRDGWLERFPMWDWVGGRTSELSAVGLLPAALQGIAIDDLLRGAQLMDRATRIPRTRDNPAALLALMWWHAGKGRGEKAMVVLPYRDRLKPLSNYLQQLVMESLGKAKSLSGELVHQGLTVLGNKGSTDQHAFVQEVVERPAKYFVNFVEVQSDTDSVQHALGIAQMPVADGVVAGDYLSGFFQGTRAALVQNGGESLTLTLRELSALTLGGLIALYERAVGLYAQLIQVNAYHQPGVEAGKLAAEKVLSIQGLVLKHLAGASRSLSVAELAQQPGLVGEEMVIFKVLQHLAVNHRVKTEPSKNIFDFRYSSL